MFLGYPDPLVQGTGTDPDSYIIEQISKKNLDSYCIMIFHMGIYWCLIMGGQRG
jgi:hypothetical protein